MASSSSNNNNAGRILKRANPSTIQDKFLVGYQGWFTCGGDGEPVGPGHHGWLHWFDAPIPDGGHPNTDLWPDVSSYSPSELFPAPGLKTSTGEPVFLFSSRNPKSVQRHFHWMAEHGVDGAFLQRFVGQCDLEAGNEGIMRIRDEVGDRVREAAEREGRVFAIMYDVAGVAPDRILRILQRDWAHLIRNKGVLDSPNYLKEKGKPVVALWGFGFDNAKHTPELVRSVLQFFRNTTPGGVYIMGGAPAHWRTAESDADRNPEFLNVWLDGFDAISPWTVGRYSTDQEADSFAENKMKGDVELIKHHGESTGKKIDYIPVVLPGGSGYNMSEGKWGFNDIKRNGGRFLWRQISNAKRLGVRSMYGAMWDEYDEGTAFMPVVEHKRLLPVSDKFRFMALDEDGYDVPADWYMRICGFAGEGLRSERRIHETFPVKELQDYWSSRPRYEQVSQKSVDFVSGSSFATDGGGGSGSGDGDGKTYEEWLAAQKNEKEDAPPPPYTLEDDEPGPAAAPAVQSRPVAAIASAAITTAANVPQGSHAVGNHPASQPYAGPTPGNGPSALNHSSPPSHQQYQTPDPVASLAENFARQNISGSSAGSNSVNHSSPLTSDGRPPAGSPPPLHPTHPAASSSTHQGFTYPTSQQPPPPIQHTSRPPSSQAYPAHNSGPVGASTATPARWPPQEWNLNQASSAPAPAPVVPHSTHPAGSPAPQTYGAVGPATLSRPHTVSAGSHSAPDGAPVRPSASLSHRPPPQPNQVSGSTLAGASPAPFPNSYSPSGFPGANTYNSPPNSYANTSPFPQPAPYNNSAFPGGPATSYPPAVTSYPGQTGYSYPGVQPGGPAYQPHGSNFAWPGGPPNASPPHSPSAASAFPGQSTYNPSRPYSPGQGSHQQQYNSFPANSRPSSASSSPYTSPPSFPQTSGGRPYYGDNSYSMPSSDPSAYSSSYGGQYSTSSSTYPGLGGPSYPQPSPWTSGAGSASMMPPPRPSNYSSTSQVKPSSSPGFPMASGAGSSALGYALTAVDKVAGRKMKEQLEGHVNDLAQTGNKLWGKFTR